MDGFTKWQQDNGMVLTTKIDGDEVMMTCQAVEEMWGPHEGCREFMDEPEAVVFCGEPAVAIESWGDHPDDQVAVCSKHRDPEHVGT